MFRLPTGKHWRFHHWVYSGTVYLDTYEELIPTQPAQDLVLIGRHYEQDLVSGRVTKRYYAEGRLLASRVAEGGNDVLRFVQADHLGSSSTITNASGQLVARERYGAFGERRRGEEPKTTEHLYTGQRLSSPSTLYHFTDGKSPGRFYDPLLGRFLQPDGAAPNYNSTQGLNPYSYTNNNPQKYVDPDGEFPILAIVAVAAVLGIGATFVAPTVANAPAPGEATVFSDESGPFLAPAKIMAGGAPLVGDINDWGAVATGYDVLAGEQITPAQRGATAIAAAIPGVSGSKARDTIGLAEEVIPSIERELSGQWHHVLSSKIMDQVGKNEALRGVLSRDDIIVQAADEASHKGYQSWHRAYDQEVVRWLQGRPQATRDEFLELLQGVYSRADMTARFPDASELIRRAQEMLP